MNTRILLAVFALAIIALFTVVPLGAAVEEGDATPLKVKKTPMRHIEPLGRTVELTFKLKSQDPQTIKIVSATTRYHAEINFAGSAAAADMRFSGELRLIEPTGKAGRNKERLLLTCSSGVTYDANESINAAFDTSTELEYGEEMYLVKYGELSITVEANLVD